MRKNHYFAGRRGWSRNEVRLGRLIRDGEGHGETQPAAGDNAGGNSGQTPGNGGESQNNSGERFDPAAFWQGPAPENKGASSGESATSKSGESGTESQNNFATQIATQIEGLNFGDVMTPEIAEQLSNGDFAGFQKNFQQVGQQIVRHALAMQVQILRPFAEQLMQEMRGELDGKFSSRDDNDTLVKDFPAAKNPTMAKTIRPIFDQALKNARGDRTVAVRQTKEMLRFMAQEASGDLGFEIVTTGEGGGSRQNVQTTNWLDTLTGR